MTYRDRPPMCPRCSIGLDRSDQGERWTCSRCAGCLVTVGDLVNELLARDPQLRSDGPVRDVGTVSRRGGEPLPCAMCGAEMEAVFLGGAEIERCRHDGVLWFDRDELDRVLFRAVRQRDERVDDGLLECIARLFR